MARIRSVKPSFNSDEVMASLSIPCRLHFVLLWTYADDEGRGIDNPRLIKAALWPLDDAVTVEQVEQWQCELHNHERIIRYSNAKGRYFAIPTFKDHQHPNRPQKSDCPDPSLCDLLVSTARSLFDHGGSIAVGEGRGEQTGGTCNALSSVDNQGKDQDAKNGDLTVAESFSTARAALAATHPRRESA